MKQLTIFFIGTKEIHPTDAFWFYYGYSASIIFAVTIMVLGID